MISATVSGRVGRDGELRSAGSTPVLSFSLASDAFRNKEKTTDWVSVSLFGQRAEKLQQYVTKGQYVVVRGTLHVREYEGKDGSTKFSLELRADDIELGGGGKKEDGASNYGGKSAHDGSAKHHENTPPDDPIDDGSIPF